VSVPIITAKDIFRPGENVFIQMSNQNSDFSGVIHKHTFIELVYIISGSAIHAVGDRELSASKGDLFIINYDTPHAFFTSNDNPEPFVAYDLLFTPDFFDMLRGGFVEFLDNLPNTPDPKKTEYFLPFRVQAGIERGECEVRVLETAAKWYGVTYAEDKPTLVAFLKSQVEAGVYPDGLWK